MMVKNVALVLIILLTVSCAPKVSDEILFSQLENLSDEEFDAVMAEDNAALAGKALAYRFTGESSNKIRATRQQIQSLTWISCSSNPTGVDLRYSYGGIKSRTLANSCSENRLEEYSCDGNKYTQKTSTCEVGCLEGKCLAALAKYTPVYNGLVGWWDGDDVVSTTANDLVNNNDGVLFNGAVNAPGKIGKSFLFDGQDDYVQIFFPNFLSKMTFAAWVKPDQFPQYSSSELTSQNGPLSWRLSVSPSSIGGINNIIFEYDDGNTHKKILAGLLPTQQIAGTFPMVEINAWRHVAFTLDLSTKQMKVYVNGIELPIAAEEYLTPEAEGFQNIIYLGTSSKVGPNPGVDAKSWDGYVDEVQLYNRVLSQAEIQAIFGYQPLPILKSEAAIIVQK